MANELQLNDDQLSSLIAQSPDIVPRLWKKDVQETSATEDVFERMTGGPGSGMPFIWDKSLENTPGNEVIVTVRAPLNGPGVMGNAWRPGKEEQVRVSTYSCKIDYWWNGVATDKQAKNNTIVFSSFDNDARKWLAGWFGRKKMNDAKMKLILASDPGRNPAASGLNIVRPNYKTSREALRSADVVSVALLDNSRVLANTNGAMAANLIKNPASKKIDNKLRRYTFFSTDTNLISLNQDSRFQNIVKDAQVRGDLNPLFAGGYSMYNGTAIFEHEIVDQDTGPAGSPENPRAKCGAAIASGTTAVQVYGGGDAYNAADTSMLYFSYFSNYPYAFTSFDAPITDATVRYAVGFNMTGANAGKFFLFSYQVNNGNQLTILNRLGATATGAQVTTLGNITYAPAATAGNPYSGLTCDSLAVGSPIFECNGSGVPVGYSYVLGTAAMIRATGRDNLNRITEDRNYKFVTGVGLECEYGQTPAKKTNGVIQNYVLCEHAIQPPGIPFPGVV